MNFISILKKISGRFSQTTNTSTKPKGWRTQLLEMMPKNSVCAEIGVWKGDYSQRILDTVRPTKLHLIDPFLFQTGYGEERPYGGKVAKSQHDMDTLYLQTTSRFHTRSNVLFHRDLSENVADDFPDAYFDWIYIDGHHYYEFVLKDLEKYFPKVKSGGYLTGDDYLWTSVELNGDKPVQRALDDFTTSIPEAFESIEILGTQFVIKKK